MSFIFLFLVCLFLTAIMLIATIYLIINSLKYNSKFYPVLIFIPFCILNFVVYAIATS